MQKRSHIKRLILEGIVVGVYTDVGCTSLASIYADDGITPLDNPITVAATEEFSYRAANGTYWEKIGDEDAVEILFDDGSDYAPSSHNHDSDYAPALGADENYVSDAEKASIGATVGIEGQYSSLRTGFLSLYGPNATFECTTTRYVPDASGVIKSTSANLPAVPGATYVSDGVWTDATTANGVLLEPGIQNRILQSQTISVTPWNTTNATIVVNSVNAPDGTLTADTLKSSNTGSSGQVVANSGTVTSLQLTANSPAVFSVFAKKTATVTWIAINADSFTTAGQVCYFDLTNGLVGTAIGNVVGSITAYSDSWYRCEMLVPDIGANNDGRMFIYAAEGNGDVTWTTLDGTQEVYLWGVQVESGVKKATSYIPTTTVALTRDATSLSIPTTNLGKNLRFKFRSNEQSGRLQYLYAADANNYLRINADKTWTIAIGGTTYSSSAFAFSADQTYNIEVVTDGRVEVLVNGTTIILSRVTTTGYTWPTTLYLGSDHNAANNINGFITEFDSVKSAIHVEPERATIPGQYDNMRVITTGATSQSVELNYVNGNAYYIDCSAFIAAQTLTLTAANWPTAAAQYGAMTVMIKTGTNNPTIAVPSGWTAIATIASKTNRVIYEKVGSANARHDGVVSY